MSLVCSICEKKGKYRVVIDMGRFTHRFYYCENHKPIKFELQEMNEKQHDDGKKIREEKFSIQDDSTPKTDFELLANAINSFSHKGTCDVCKKESGYCTMECEDCYLNGFEKLQEQKKNVKPDKSESLSLSREDICVCDHNRLSHNAEGCKLVDCLCLKFTLEKDVESESEQELQKGY